MMLRDFLHLDKKTISPWVNNVAASQLMVLYFKICLETILWLHVVRNNPNHHVGSHGGGGGGVGGGGGGAAHGVLTRMASRCCLHILLSSCLLFWPLFDTSDWSWRLNALVPTVMMTRYIYKGAMVKDPDDIEVQSMSRNTSSSSILCSRPSDLLFGPTQFAAILVYLGLYRFMTQEAAILVAALGVGDACLAPMVGLLFGRHVYHMPLADAKTMEGSLSVFVGTCLGIYLLLPCMGLPLLPLRMVLVHAGLAAVVEGSSPSHVDNLAIALLLHFSMSTVQEWLLLTPPPA